MDSIVLGCIGSHCERVAHTPFPWGTTTKMQVEDFNALLDDEDVDLIFTLEEELASGSFGTVYRVCYACPGLAGVTRC